MDKLILSMTEIVQEHNNKPVTTSLKVAEVFEKMHKNVIRDIESLDIPNDFGRLNFEPTNYTDTQGKVQKAYEITKDGFTLLAMGYNGEKAMKFKIAYIQAFNAMETELRKRSQTKEAQYFEQKSELILEKHKLDTEIKRLNTLLQTSPEGKKLSETQKQLSEIKNKIEKLERKQFSYVYTLFPILENE